jgi:hypothetical protein
MGIPHKSLPRNSPQVVTLENSLYKLGILGIYFPGILHYEDIKEGFFANYYPCVLHRLLY